MSAESSEATGPDLTGGIRVADIPDGGMFGGHVGDQAVLLSRNGDDVFAIGGQCTHYGAPLAEGLAVSGTVRCPWHHACFDLRTGEAVRAPALNPVSRWEIEREGDSVRVVREIPAPDGATPIEGRTPVDAPEVIVVVGAGAAGNAAAEMLRREGYAGRIVMIGGDESVPYDRPNLSKDYLAGNAPEEWIPLRQPEFYAEHGIDLTREVWVKSIDTSKRTVSLSNGREERFDRLLLATGADPVRLPLTGAGSARVHYLRSLADSRSIIESAKSARTAVVIGSSFIGLEAAASLRTRGIDVHVVAPEQVPLEKVLGPELGAYVRGVHEQKGVVFHLGHTVTAAGERDVTLDDGSALSADLVVVGVGVRPMTQLAEGAGAATDKGVVVNEYLETTIPGVFAAGDIARFPDADTGEPIRIEHWVVAERQGQTAARNMLGKREAFTSVPFFWSNHYDTSIHYVGHVERWDEIRVAGDAAAGDCMVAYRVGGKTRAVATVRRSIVALEAEAALERYDWSELDSLFEREAAR